MGEKAKNVFRLVSTGATRNTSKKGRCFLCRIGWHRYSAWQETYRSVGMLSTIIQECRCECCGYTKIKSATK